MGEMGMLEIGSIFAERYRIVHPLGHGAMGFVYIAEQLATGARRALKMMHPQLAADPRFIMLFEQEARVGHRIKSDHIVQVIDAGVDAATSIPWLSMELLEGEDLGAHLVRFGLLPPAKVAEILAQLCHALSAAHELGIVHRDIKPENVFLAAPRREGVDFTVKVLDFGIAKLVAEATLRGTMPIGTPLWMAPEQANGGAVSPATDVWALGLMAFRMLTGHYYWQSGGTDAIPVLHEILYEPLVSATARAAAYGCPNLIPPGLDAWFSRCVERDKGARLKDAGAARRAMRGVFLRGDEATVEVALPTPIPPPPPREELDPHPPGAAFDPRWYVPRDQEQREVWNYLAFPGKPVVLWGPSRLGKTWLLDHCAERLRSGQDFEVVAVDPRLLDRSSLDSLLQSLAAKIIEARDQPPDSMPAAWSRPGSASNKLTWLMERIVLPSVKCALILVIDGIDTLWGSQVGDDLFALLRAWAEFYHAPWTRLRLALSVSVTPALLIKDPNRSPFNLTTPIVIGDFRAEQVGELAQRYRLRWDSGDIERLMAFVGGHPYLVRLLMHRAALHATPLSELLDASLGSRWILSQDVERIRSWLERSGLKDLALRVAREPGCRLEPSEVHRLTDAGIVVEGAAGSRRLRNRLYEIAVGALSSPAPLSGALP